MKSNQVLNQASVLVQGQREKDYGDKTENHNNIAKLWSAYLDIKINEDLIINQIKKLIK